jgi:hypothetical protein
VRSAEDAAERSQLSDNSGQPLVGNYTKNHCTVPQPAPPVVVVKSAMLATCNRSNALTMHAAQLSLPVKSIQCREMKLSSARLAMPHWQELQYGHIADGAE